jgi:hypothetical protein
MKANEAKALSDDINNLNNNNQLKRTLVAIENAAKKGHYAIKIGYNELNQAVIVHLKSLGYKINMESSNDPREESYMLISWQ